MFGPVRSKFAGGGVQGGGTPMTRRKRVLLLALTTAPLGLVAASPSTPRARAVVRELPGTNAHELHAEGAIEIQAPVGTVWDTVIDFDARVDESWMIQSVTIYDEQRKGAHLDRGARWDLNILGVKVIYSTRYLGDRTQGTIRWALDDTKENDMKSGSGEYVISPVPGDPTSSRIVYTFAIASDQSVAGGLRRRLTVKGVRRTLEQIRARAEQGS